MDLFTPLGRGGKAVHASKGVIGAVHASKGVIGAVHASKELLDVVHAFKGLLDPSTLFNMFYLNKYDNLFDLLYKCCLCIILSESRLLIHALTKMIIL